MKRLASQQQLPRVDPGCLEHALLRHEQRQITGMEDRDHDYGKQLR
jgi:hypothetical protein